MWIRGAQQSAAANRKTAIQSVFGFQRHALRRHHLARTRRKTDMRAPLIITTEIDLHARPVQRLQRHPPAPNAAQAAGQLHQPAGDVHQMISAGDQFIWNFPNCGNPQKVQRYPIEWAESLRAMAAKDAELFVPAHGLPIAGRDRIKHCLDTVATTLETLVAEVLDAMNTGATLDEIVHGVSVPADTLALPYLRPLYDEPEFVIRNIWRLFGGWYDGNPARLKPPSDTALGTEVASLAGGVDRLVERAVELSGRNDHRLACQLIEYAVAAEPESHAVHEARSTIYAARRATETSLMAKGIYLSAKADSDGALSGDVPPVKMILNIGE